MQLILNKLCIVKIPFKHQFVMDICFTLIEDRLYFDIMYLTHQEEMI